MKLPERITVRIACEGAEDLSGVILCLKVRSGRKNPYYISFPKTDRAGRSELDRDEFVGQFKDHWETFPMDYSGTVESADPRVEVELFDPTWSLQNRALALAWPLSTHEKTKWASREQEYEYRVSCRNPAFTGQPLAVDLESTGAISFQLALRKDPPGDPALRSPRALPARAIRLLQSWWKALFRRPDGLASRATPRHRAPGQVQEPTQMRVTFAFFEGSSMLHKGEFLAGPERSLAVYGEHQPMPIPDGIAFVHRPDFQFFSGLTIEHAFELPACPVTLCYYRVSTDPETSSPRQTRVLRSELRMGVHDSEDWESLDLLQYTFAFKCAPLA